MEKDRKLKAIIFDLDGVITDSAKYHYLAWKELADELNIPVDEEYNEKLKGVSRIESLNLILKNGNAENDYTPEEKEKLADKKNAHYKELIKEITSADMLPGIENFLKEIKANDIRTALASVSKNAFFIIKQLQAEKYFDYIADAAAVPNAKPFPDIFLVGAEHLGVRPEECIGVEDARTGIEAIHRAGMLAVGVGTPAEMEDADLVLTTSELRLELILDKLNLELERPV